MVIWPIRLDNKPTKEQLNTKGSSNKLNIDAKNIDSSLE